MVCDCCVPSKDDHEIIDTCRETKASTLIHDGTIPLESAVSTFCSNSLEPWIISVPDPYLLI
jgi:hypothetical protein